MAEKNNNEDDREKQIRTLLKSLDHKDDEGTIKILKKDLKLMTVTKGDVLAVRRVPGLTQENIDWLADALSRAGLDGCIVVVVNQMSDVRVLSEHIMNQHGWFREQESE